MKRFFLAAALFSLLMRPANAVFFTYAQWDALPSNLRSAYIAGLYDALVSFANDEGDQRVATHYQQCIARSKMNNAQMADNIRSFTSARPELQGNPVGGALIAYLIKLCGMPPA